MDAPIPVTVVTGFLGAGKSTLLERWLGELPSDTAVIVNEEGSIGIDGELLAQRAARIREITGGCICCVTHAALEAALAEFAASTPSPSRILIETSGAASPAGVIRALTWGTARDRLRLDGVVTVIDAARAAQTIEFALTVEQLGFADVVAISHVDQRPEAELVALEQEIVTYAPGAVVTRVCKGRLQGPGGGTLLDLLETRASVLHSLPAHEQGITRHGIDAVSLLYDGELDELRFGDWVEGPLAALEARILRIKGILAVRGVDARVIIQGVSAAVGVTLGLAWGNAEPTSRLVILGLDLDAAALRAGFSGCAATPARPEPRYSRGRGRTS